MVIRGGWGMSYLPASGTSYSTTQNNATPMPDFSVLAQSYSYISGQANPN